MFFGFLIMQQLLSMTRPSAVVDDSKPSYFIYNI